ILTCGGTRADSPWRKSSGFTSPLKPARNRRIGICSNTSMVQNTSTVTGWKMWMGSKFMGAILGDGRGQVQSGQGLESFVRYRLAGQVTLESVAALFGQEGPLCLGFHALGDH